MIVLDLPMPPSTNHIWGHSSRQVFTAPAYARWKTRADNAILTSGRKHQRIDGKFKVEIALERRTNHGDIDNRIKPALDYLQSREYIRNDSDCEEIKVRWCAHSEAPLGCRITLEAV